MVAADANNAYNILAFEHCVGKESKDGWLYFMQFVRKHVPQAFAAGIWLTYYLTVQTPRSGATPPAFSR